MEDYLQTEFTDLRVWLTSTTEQWATIAVQGPRARETIAPLIEGVDLAGDALPHMSLREARVCGVPTRLMRVSFTGELGYEINVPSHFGRAVWEAAWREVQKQGGCAYGTEAMHVMRAEKGYVIVGQETDGTVTLADLGLDGMIGKTKKDFVGKRSLTRPDMLVDNRKQLVGLLTDNPAITLEEGAQVTESASPPIGSSALGHVTSSYMSATLGRPIALALVAAGRSRMGSTLHVPMPGRRCRRDGREPGFLRQRGSAAQWLMPRLKSARRLKVSPSLRAHDLRCRKRRQRRDSFCAGPRRCASPAEWRSVSSRLRDLAQRARAKAARLCGSGPTNGS